MNRNEKELPKKCRTGLLKHFTALQNSWWQKHRDTETHAHTHTHSPETATQPGVMAPTPGFHGDWTDRVISRIN